MNKCLELEPLKYTIECESIEEMEELKAKLNNKTEFDVRLSDDIPLKGKLKVEFLLRDLETKKNKGEIKMNKKVFKNLTEEKIEKIKAELIGLSASEWGYIKIGMDMYFNKKAANIKIDDSTELDSYLKRKY